jgi:hypothetical protein
MQTSTVLVGFDLIRSAVTLTGITGPEKAVLLVLATMANGQAQAWPPMTGETGLVAKCCLGERTVQRAIQALAANKHITREEKLGKGVVYTVHPRHSGTPATETPRQTDAPATQAATPATAAPKQPRTTIPKKGKPSLERAKIELPMDDLTPWEEINPPMASAPRPEPPSQYSDLTPATAAEFRNELTACLALVVPVGMSEEARRDWLTVAWGTLKFWPVDLLRIGCEEARRTCDHPAKIVPAIVEATQDSLERRRDRARARWAALHRRSHPQEARHGPPRRVDEPRGHGRAERHPRTARRLGSVSSDGSRYMVEQAA